MCMHNSNNNNNLYASRRKEQETFVQTHAHNFPSSMNENLRNLIL